MHILIVAFGYGSDVYPLIGLGRTILREGHQVTICTHPSFSAAVDHAGLRLLPLGTEEEYEGLLTGPSQSGGSAPFTVLASMMGRYMRPMIALLRQAITEDTVMVGSPWAFGARMMQEKYGVPYVSVQLSPASILAARAQNTQPPTWLPSALRTHVWRSGLSHSGERSALDKLCGPELNAVRKELGLPRLRDIAEWVHTSAAEIGMFPNWFAAPETQWPRDMKLTGFPLYDSAELWKKDDELEKFLQTKPAPIIFAPGHDQVQTSGYFQAANEVLTTMGERGIFLTRPGGCMPVLAKNILVRPYVPLSRLLPRARALVHPGGTGGVSQALAAGTPQLVVPVTFDQIDNAAQVERLGCGLQMKNPLTAPELLPMLTQLLNDGGLHAACEVRRHRVAAGEKSRRNALAVIESVTNAAVRPLLPDSQTRLDIGMPERVAALKTIQH